MPSFEITKPYPVFTDVDGDPLNGGNIYIGDYGLDAESNQISVYWDEALTQLAAQPIVTRGGFPLNSGAIGRLYTGAINYSIVVKNKNATLVRSFDHLGIEYGDGPDTVSDLALIDGLQIGQSISTKGCLTVGDGGHGTFIVESASGTPDGYSRILLANGNHAVILEPVTVKNFGVYMDGVQDDSPGINRFVQYHRSKITNAAPATQGNAIHIVFDSGIYLCLDSINMTGLKGQSIRIESSGALFIGKCTGKPVIDMLNCRWYSMTGIAIWGDQTNTPTYGIQIGRTLLLASSAGDGSFEDVSVQGYFSTACLYNFTAETVQYRHLRLYNRYAGSNAYCLIMDGQNEYNIQSQFTSQSNAVGVEVSFNENNFYGCDFRKENGGDCIRIVALASRHNYFSCYAAADNGNIVDLYKPRSMFDLSLDIHAEVDLGSGGVENFLFIDNTNPSSTINLSGLKIRDHQPQCRNAIIHTSGGTTAILMQNSEIDVGDIKNTIPLFSSATTASSQLFTGTIKWPSNKNLNLSTFYFNGSLYATDSTVITHTIGAYNVIRRPSSSGSRITEFKGFLHVLGSSDSTDASNYLDLRGSTAGGTCLVAAKGTDSDVTLQLESKGADPITLVTNGSVVLETSASASSVNYLRASAATTGNSPSLSPRGSDANLDLRLVPKGTGLIRFGTAVSAADTTSTHRLAIKDEATGTTYYILCTTVSP